MTSQQCNDLWPKFRDIIIHDNTALINQYYFLSLFVLVNYDSKIRLAA